MPQRKRSLGWSLQRLPSCLPLWLQFPVCAGPVAVYHQLSYLRVSLTGLYVWFYAHLSYQRVRMGNEKNLELVHNREASCLSLELRC